VTRGTEKPLRMLVILSLKQA